MTQSPTCKRPTTAGVLSTTAPSISTSEQTSTPTSHDTLQHATAERRASTGRRRPSYQIRQVQRVHAGANRKTGRRSLSSEPQTVGDTHCAPTLGTVTVKDSIDTVGDLNACSGLSRCGSSRGPERRRSISAEVRLRPNHRGLVRVGTSSRDGYQLPQGDRKANLGGE